MANNILPSIGVPIWYCVVKTDESPVQVSTIFKLQFPVLLIDNSTDLANRSGILRTSYQGMVDYINDNSVDLNGHSIDE